MKISKRMLQGRIACACQGRFSLRVFVLLATGAAGCASIAGSSPTQSSSKLPNTLEITSASLPSAIVQSQYKATLSASGGKAPYKWSVTGGSLPPGVTMTAAGLISGNPTLIGTFSFMAQVADSSFKSELALAPMKIIVAGTSAPKSNALKISTTSLPEGRLASSYATTLSATGGLMPYKWAISSGQLPPGLSLNPSSGEIAGSPSKSGNFDLTVSVKDGSKPDQSATASLSITVSGDGSVLQIVTSSVPPGETGSPYSAMLEAVGGTAPYRWSVTAGHLAPGLTLSSAGEISGTPTQNGIFGMIVQVTDSGSPLGVVRKGLNISITSGITVLEITSVSLPGAQMNSPYSDILAAIGGTKPYTWTITRGALAGGLNLNTTTGAITGTPTNSGSFSVTAQVQDHSVKGESATKTFSLTVAPSEAPVQISTASSLPNGQVSTPYSESLIAAGGTAPYSWAVTSGSLPAGLAVSSAQISGTPTQSGNASFIVQVTDSSKTPQRATKSFILNIAAAIPALRVTTASVPTGQQGHVYSTTLAATGGTAPYKWSIASGSLPSGLALDSEGLIAGTPTKSGTVAVTVRATDSSTPPETATVSLSLKVAIAPRVTTPVQIATSSLPSGRVGTIYSATLTADGGTSPYNWSTAGGSFPPGLGLNPSGQISGMPTSAAMSSVAVQVTDSSNPPQVAMTDLSVSVAPAIAPVQIATSSLPTAQVGDPYSASLTANGGTTPYTWSVSGGSLPAGLALGASGQITGTPTTTGTASFSVRATDSGSSPQTATASFSISVTAAITPVQITTSSLSVGQVNRPYAASMSANGGDGTYSWSLNSGSLPAGLNINATGQISGTPTSSGTATFAVRVTDSSSPVKSATGNFDITVVAATSPIQITTSSLPAGQVGNTYSASLASNGGTGPYSWSLAGGSLPVGLTLNASGQIGGTPTVSGTSSFAVRVMDSSSPAQTTTANLNLSVTAAVAPVQITTFSLPSGQVGNGYSASFSATGGTGPYSWSISSGSLPSGLTLSSSGQLSGTPTSAGTGSFTVRVSDSGSPAKTATATFSVLVAAAIPPLQITTSSLPTGQAGIAYSMALTASGGTSPYSWSISSGTLPAGLSLSGSGQISGIPSASGSGSLTVQVRDSGSPTLTATRSLGITINAGTAPLQITTTSLPDGQVTSTYSSTLAVTGGTPPYTYSITSGALPLGVSLNPINGQISGLPTATGTSSFTISVKDSGSPQQTQTQVLSVFVAPVATGNSISSCQTLGSAGTTYVLQSDVSASGTCFSISAANVTLNLNGHTVTYNTGSQGSAVHAIVDTTGNSEGFTVYGGTLSEGSGSATSASHVIQLAPISSGPTIHDVMFNWNTPYSQAINTDYENVGVAGGAQIYNNTLNNNNSAACNQVSCRDLLQSASIRISDAIRTTSPPQIYNNTINGGPQGSIECDAPNCVLHDNILNPGNASVENSNDFAIWCWASCNAYNNTIMTPLTANSGARGVEISGVETSTNGANIHNNTITVITKPIDAEYGGCELGGAYGIQFDDNGTGAIAQSNRVTAVSNQCWGTGLRLTDTETQTNISQSNTFSAIRQSSSSPACTYIGGGTDAGCAHAVAFAGPLGFLSRNDTFEGDSDDFFFDWDGAAGVTFVAPTFLRGTTNPSPNFHTFVFRNGGTPVSNIHVQDATFGSGTSVTDTDLPAQGGNNQPASLYIDWSQTITVNKSSGGVAAGATISFTDALGKTYSATTNSSGVATVVVTQYRLNNDSTANGIENHNPFTRNVSAQGCSTSSSTGLSISGTTSAVVTLGGC